MSKIKITKLVFVGFSLFIATITRVYGTLYKIYHIMLHPPRSGNKQGDGGHWWSKLPGRAAPRGGVNFH